MTTTKKTGVIVLLSITLLVIQMLFNKKGIPIDLLILPVYAVSIRCGYQKGFWAGVLIGFIEDTLSGGFLGPSILSKGLMGIVSGSLFGRVFIWRPLVGWLTLLLLGALDYLIQVFALLLFWVSPGSLTDILIYSALSGLIVSPAGYLIGPEDGQ
ncbi:MAG: hypothetical protein D6726_01725 [Nitrospirae bacterium]|nr:MAG: hypothetical protein D6726_01725 [Nitrospirota bacterium]